MVAFDTLNLSIHTLHVGTTWLHRLIITYVALLFYLTNRQWLWGCIRSTWRLQEWSLHIQSCSHLDHTTWHCFLCLPSWPDIKWGIADKWDTTNIKMSMMLAFLVGLNVRGYKFSFYISNRIFEWYKTLVLSTWRQGEDSIYLMLKSR